ncbi:DUF5067 domain-containing protein [Microbacterium sp. NPDC058389]|uniref:DUF5067 domain-containing protein n=1 Tax=Microbacterium sp. NPDC058389 TaxID=3346475 RepID=UPI00366368B5
MALAPLNVPIASKCRRWGGIFFVGVYMHTNGKLALGIATIAVAAFTLVGCSSAAPESSAPNTGETIAVDAPAKDTSADATFENQTLTTPDLVIKITAVKTIAVGEAGNEYGDAPVIAFWYDTTNVSGEDLDPTTAWISSFTAYQDNDPNAENELNIASLPDQAFLDSQIEKIKEGGTVSNAVAYTLTDTTTPVELVASIDFGMTEVGSATFQLQ